MSTILADPALQLADAWQRDFPLIQRPFDEIGRASGLTGMEVIGDLAGLAARGRMSRIGATVRPNTIGASTLAALAAPAADLDRIAATVNGFAQVNHNYERENRLNLWFVVTARSGSDVDRVLDAIARETGCDVHDLRLEQAHHIDLGFRLGTGTAPRRKPDGVADYRPEAIDIGLMDALADGLPLTCRPYRDLGRRVGLGEEQVIARLGHLVAAGVVTRLGCILRHRRLGYRANAMAVWDVPDDRAADLGQRLARQPGVTLCYRRRRASGWPYSLYAMVHGRERAIVERQIAAASSAAGLDRFAHETLFSRRCFKQTAARFAPFGREEAA